MMLQKSFLISMSLASVITIALVMLAKNISQAFGSISRKDNLALLFIGILNAVILFSITYLVVEPFSLFWIYSFIFLLFGIVNVVFAQNKFEARPDEKKFIVGLGNFFFNLAVVFFVCVISSLLQFYLKDRAFLFYPVMCSGLAFLVPVCFSFTFDAAVNIPPTDYTVWEYPLSQHIDPPDESDNERLYVIGFDIPKRIGDKKTSFRARAPENIILGELFYHFINEYNEEKGDTLIEYLDAGKKPIVWWFRLKRKWYQRNIVLDPSQRIRDNHIRENSVIICEQIIPADNK